MNVPEGSRKLIAYISTVVSVAIMSATGGLEGESAAQVIQWAFVALVAGNAGEHAARALGAPAPRNTAEMRERFGTEVLAPVEINTPADPETPVRGTTTADIRDRVREENTE